MNKYNEIIFALLISALLITISVIVIYYCYLENSIFQSIPSVISLIIAIVIVHDAFISFKDKKK